MVDDVVWGSSRSTSPLFMAATALRMASVASVASASAQTVRERLKKDPGLRVYAVVFGVTATTNSAPPAVRLVEGGDLSKRPARSADAVKIDVPDAYIKQRTRRFRQSLQSLR